MTKERSIKFTGTGLQALGWGLLAALLTLLIIPTAWGVAALYRWFVRNLSFSDGAAASFEGRGGQVWYYFVISFLVAMIPSVLMKFVPTLSRAAVDPTASFFMSLGLTILILPITAAIGLKILRWTFSSIRLSSGTNLIFEGRYGAYLGWTLLVTLSVYTIIGWAWALVAMTRWICRNLNAGQNRLEFLGNGWGLLWRCVLASLASILIIPIPWVWVWVLRWVVGNMLIEREPLS
jgi:hypothetical protein